MKTNSIELKLRNLTRQLRAEKKVRQRNPKHKDLTLKRKKSKNPLHVQFRPDTQQFMRQLRSI